MHVYNVSSLWEKRQFLNYYWKNLHTSDFPFYWSLFFASRPEADCNFKSCWMKVFLTTSKCKPGHAWISGKIHFSLYSIRRCWFQKCASTNLFLSILSYIVALIKAKLYLPPYGAEVDLVSVRESSFALWCFSLNFKYLTPSLKYSTFVVCSAFSDLWWQHPILNLCFSIRYTYLTMHKF